MFSFFLWCFFLDICWETISTEISGEQISEHGMQWLWPLCTVPRLPVVHVHNGHKRCAMGNGTSSAYLSPSGVAVGGLFASIGQHWAWQGNHCARPGHRRGGNWMPGECCHSDSVAVPLRYTRQLPSLNLWFSWWFANTYQTPYQRSTMKGIHRWKLLSWILS